MGLGLGVRRGLIAPFVLALVLLLGASCAAEDDPSPMLAEGVIDRSAEARRPVDGSAGHSVDFASISVGGNHGCGVRSGGSLECWGDDEFGQASPLPGTFVSVTSGVEHSCGLRSDGSVECWGHDTDGRSTHPSAAFASAGGAKSPACWVETGGSVSCPGRGFQTSPPPGTVGDAASPGVFSSVSAGWYHSCGVTSDGSVACWGYAAFGRATPPPGTFTSVSAGSLHTCGVRTDGSVECWGYNADGRSARPPGTFSSVSAGGTHSCGVRRDGSVECWGGSPQAPSTALVP